MVTRVGRISSANARGAGRKALKAAIMIIGMAKPTAPLTKPANSVTPAAAANRIGSGVIIGRSAPFFPFLAGLAGTGQGQSAET